MCVLRANGPLVFYSYSRRITLPASTICPVIRYPVNSINRLLQFLDIVVVMELIAIETLVIFMIINFTALQDLEPSQLLLFVQSFGIPVNSMSKLLQCLDNAVAMDPVALEQSVIDKAYMAQLIEVQHLRGAKGGEKFYFMLTDGGSLEAPTGWFIEND